MKADEVRALVSLERTRMEGRDADCLTRWLAYEEEGGREDALYREVMGRARARLYGLKARGFVATERFLLRGVRASRLAWRITHAGRKALHEALQVRCPYCGGRKGEGMPHPLGHHKMSCYATRTVEPALERAFGQGRAE